MLRVVGYEEAGAAGLIVDEFVPFSFRRLDGAPNTPLYWRSGDLHKSLVEVGLDDSSGAVSKVTVLQVDSFELASEKRDEDASIGARVLRGLPVCETSNWPSDRILDDPGVITAVLYQRTVSVWLGSREALATMAEADRVRFGIDSGGGLRCLEFFDLSDEEMQSVLYRLREVQGESDRARS